MVRGRRDSRACIAQHLGRFRLAVPRHDEEYAKGTFKDLVRGQRAPSMFLRPAMCRKGRFCLPSHSPSVDLILSNHQDAQYASESGLLETCTRFESLTASSSTWICRDSRRVETPWKGLDLIHSIAEYGLPSNILTAVHSYMGSDLKDLSQLFLGPRDWRFL